MKIAAPLLAIGLIAGASAAGAAPQAADPGAALTGAWRLVRYADTPSGGSPVYPFGQHPAGLFQFGPDGMATLSIMRNPPEAAGPSAGPNSDSDTCQPAWYCSYFGHYTVDAARGRWTVHVEGGNIPAYFNTDQTRAFRIEGNQLILTYTYQSGGGTVTAERVLERVR